VQQHVGIAMSNSPFVVRHVYAANHKVAPFGQLVIVYS
jgi:hypothetical protein